MPKMNLSDLKTPILLVDYDKLEYNIRSMAAKAKKNGVNLRPHIKTHKCIEIGKKQLENGAVGITVSTLGEADAFADAGFRDISYAVPLALDKFQGVRRISEKTHLNLLVDHPKIVDHLERFCREARMKLDVLVKVDCGYPRCGIDPKSPSAVTLVKKIHENPNLHFKGILTHAGHSYNGTTVEEIKTIAKQEQEIMVQFAETLKAESAQLAPEVVSIGSTPTTLLTDTFRDGITEIRPGNYVFFDYTQVALGSCQVADCALTVLSSVISKNKDRIVIDAGATALSKDQGPTHIIPNPGYGQVIRDYDAGSLESGVIIDALSQEHGKLVMTKDATLHFEHGDKIRILPNHSCLTANLYDNYHVVKGDTVINRWRVRRERFE